MEKLETATFGKLRLKHKREDNLPPDGHSGGQDFWQNAHHNRFENSNITNVAGNNYMNIYYRNGKCTQ